MQDDIMTMLSGGKVRVNTNTFQNDFSTVASKDDALTALLHLGYLGYDAERKSAYIPNYEVATAFEATTSNSNISFTGQAGEKIKFSFRSNIEDGELEIILYDSDGNAVYELDQAKALETYFVLEKSDTYTLEAEYTNFIGDYKIAVYKVKRS